jgi:hypothetical protein
MLHSTYVETGTQKIYVLVKLTYGESKFRLSSEIPEYLTSNIP